MDTTDLKIVTKDSLYNGMIVYNADGIKGIVRDCNDLHNVHITFDGDGLTVTVGDTDIECGESGLYCFVTNCPDNIIDDEKLYY